jgi:hyaluronate lyase
MQKGLRETGANLSDKCQNLAIRALLTDDAEKLTIARDGLSQIFHYVTVGDGYHADGSFIQHNDVPYTGTYGIVLLGGLARLFTFFAGTPWEVKDEGLKIVFDAVERTYTPFIYNGLMMDGVSGRAITRSGSRDRGHGRGAMAAILLLAEGVPPEYAAAYRARVKGWLLRGGSEDFLKNADLPSISRAQAILKDASIPATPEPVNHRLFHDMDRAVHRRPGWALEISMCSSRISRYESSIHSENKHGWYTGDGMTYLYLDGDPGHFTDDYWATVNCYRLPGTTVDTRQREDNSGGGRPKTRWVGGACLNELYAAVGMELEGFGSTLRAKKSWFCVDDAILCLGAGITSTDGRSIETIIENRNLRGDGQAVWQVSGVPMPLETGTGSLSNVSWAHLEGVGGYVFPLRANLQAVREKRDGTWNAVGSLSTNATPISRHYLTLWLDHGPNPTGAGYAYVLLPNATPLATGQYAKTPGFELLSNTETVQAVRMRQTGLILANFWAAGSIEGVTVNGPCSMVLQGRSNSFEVAISDPSRTAATVQVTIDVPVKTAVRADETITVLQTAPRLVLEVKTEKSRGKTHSAKFNI